MLAALSLMVLPALAGQTDCRVETILEADARGELRPVKTAEEAWVSREGALVPLWVGATLALSEPIRTGRAELRIACTGRAIHLGEGTEMRLDEAGVLQDLGAVFYEVKGYFRVRYATTEAVVEGTRFSVTGLEGGAVRVDVDEGTVRVIVDDAGDGAPVRRGEQATTRPGSAPTIEKAVKNERRRWRERAGVGSRLRLGVLAGSGVAKLPGTDPSPEIRLEPFVTLNVPGPVDLTVSTGVANTRTATGFPLVLGPELRVGPLGIGVSGYGILGYQPVCATGGVRLVFRGGATASARLRIPVSMHLALEGRLLAGWANGPILDTAVGASYRF